MRILILEDDEQRNNRIRQALISHNATFTTAAAEAIEALSTLERFDLASLDHDLGGGQMLPSDESSGYHVAEFIASMDPGERPAPVIVHSFNPAGAAADLVQQTLGHADLRTTSRYVHARPDDSSSLYLPVN